MIHFYKGSLLIFFAAPILGLKSANRYVFENVNQQKNECSQGMASSIVVRVSDSGSYDPILMLRPVKTVYLWGLKQAF